MCTGYSSHGGIGEKKSVTSEYSFLRRTTNILHAAAPSIRVQEDSKCYDDGDSGPCYGLQFMCFGVQFAGGPETLICETCRTRTLATKFPL